jgi:hypothetical protein
MDFKKVTSGHIAEIGYDEPTKTLGVRFRSGAEYHYAGVPSGKHAELMSASSKGAFFRGEVDGKHKFRRVS